MNLSGTPVRADQVLRLADLLDNGLAAKLRRAVTNENSIVALSVADRQRIVEALDEPPSGLGKLRRVLLGQPSLLHRREEQQRRMRGNALRLENRHG